ncbi:MAG: exopolyphosphatase, partial [Lachnospiraceae bacterium]|nr:exopolyphosphatase [Lachnospiraceae bacterium]
AETSYAIIKDSEIMGISHKERGMIATIVQNSYPNNISYDRFKSLEFDSRDEITMIKLTAILRVATGLAKNTEKTIRDLSAQLKDKELTIKVTTKDRMLLEKGLFSERNDTFEEVFGVTPKLLIKRVNA